MLTSQSIVCLECQGEWPAELPPDVAAVGRSTLAGLLDGCPDRWRLLVPAGTAPEALGQWLGRETGVGVEVMAGDFSEWSAVADARLLLHRGQHPEAAPGWALVHAGEGPGAAPGWLAGVLAQAGVSLADGAERILERSEALQMRVDRRARRSHALLLAVEASCVLLPLVWLLRAPLQLTPLTAAWVGLAGPLLILAAGSWQRRHGFGLTRARLRLLAAACRSWLATQSAPARPVIPLLSSVAALRPLLQTFVAAPRAQSPDWRADYLRWRIAPAHTGELLQGRDRFDHWRRRLLQLVLTLGIACVLVSLHPRSASWMTQLGGVGFDLAAALVGLSLPLGLLLIRALRSVDAAGDSEPPSRLAALPICWEIGHVAAVARLREAEHAWLDPVLERYLQAESAYRGTGQRDRLDGSSLAQAPDHGQRWLRAIAAAAGPVGRVLFASIPAMALGAALALMWISAKQPETAGVGGRLKELGRMLDPWTGEMFTPQPLAAANGTLVITHGLRDGWHRVYPGADFACGGRRAHWTTEIAQQVRQRSGERAPQVMVLDWSEGARASSLHGLNTQDPVTSFLADLGGVRASAEATGDLLGIRLARMVEYGQIRPDRPLQLIGQSAGGFVVARAARVLVAMGFPKSQVHLTLLETPEPGDALAQDLVRYATTEFYRSSNLTRVEPGDLPPEIHYARIPLADPPPPNEKAAHDYAPDWYCQTTVAAACGSDGFGRSPFCR
jgi:hypothetical protein